MTSVIEMLELANCGGMTTSAIQFESHNKIFLVSPWTEIMLSSPLF